MRKVFLLTALLTACSNLAFAQSSNTRSAEDALNAAMEFLPLSRDGENVKPELAFTEKDSVSDHPYYYIFNRGKEQGFIIICADSRSKKVLAYSNEGHFDLDSAAPEMRAWLGGYTEALSDLAQTPDSILANLKPAFLSKGVNDDSEFAREVKPLLGDICYAQSFPYNAKCPNMSLTGCVATGAVQIMRYYEFPKQSSGKTHTYDNNGETVSSSFNTTYDWSNMLPTYGRQGGSDTENDAISKIMFDAGVSCDMEYSPSASSANRVDMAKAMVEYFGYSTGMLNFRRDAFTPNDFIYYLKKELNEGRPVLMGGTDEEEYGHCFVCDGYDANGLFHFNWGWNGASNGYFEISNLCPPRPGSKTGAKENYNENVAFVGGICPPKDSNYSLNVLSMEGLEAPKNCKKGAQIWVRISRVRNLTVGNFNGQFGVAIFKDGKFMKTIDLQDANLTPKRSYRDIQFAPHMPSDLSNGNYQLVMVSKADEDTKWRPIITAGTGCIDFAVKGDVITFTPNNTDRYIDFGFETASSDKKQKSDNKKSKDKKKKETKKSDKVINFGDLNTDDFYN